VEDFESVTFLDLQKMENSKNHNDNLGLNKVGKNIRKSSFQQTISFGNDIISSSRHLYPNSDFYVVRQEEFKSFIQNVTGNQSNQLKSQEMVTRLQKIRPPPLSIVRQPIPVMVSKLVPPSQAPSNTLLGHHVESINCPPIVYNSENNLVESSVSALMRNFQHPTMNFGDSRGNQYQLYPSQPQVFNNINAQYQPIIQSQECYYPPSGSNQVVNGFPSTQTNVSNPSASLNATNPTFHMSDCNQPVIGFSSSQTNNPLSPTSKFMLPSPKSNMNFLSPKSPYRPLLSPSLFSSPSSPEYPLYSLLVPDPPSPLSSSLFPSATGPNRANNQ